MNVCTFYFLENSFPGWCFDLCLVSDVRQAGFVANLGVAFADDWAFLIGRVVGNEKD